MKICIDQHDHETLHIFSTPEKAQAFSDADDGDKGHVIYSYVVDHPERPEQVTQ